MTNTCVRAWAWGGVSKELSAGYTEGQRPPEVEVHAGPGVPQSLADCPLSFQVAFIPYEGKGSSESLTFAR